MISCCLNRVQAAVIPLLLVPMLSFAQGRGRNGLQIFITHCAVCHRSNSGTRAPLPEVLQQMEEAYRDFEEHLPTETCSALAHSRSTSLLRKAR